MSRAAGYRPPDTIELIRMNLSMLEQSLKNEDTGTAAKCVDAAEAMFKGLRQVCSAAGCDVGPSKWDVAEETKRLERDEELAERAEIPPPPLTTIQEAFLRGPVDQFGAIGGSAAHCERKWEHRYNNRFQDEAAYFAQVNRTDAQVRAERKLRDFGAAGGMSGAQLAAIAAEPPPWLRRLQFKQWGWGVLARLTWTWWCCAAGMFVRFIKAEQDRR